MSNYKRLFLEQYKYIFITIVTHNRNPILIEKIKKGEKGVWQRRYWEHSIRNEQDFYRHLDYIHFNPIKHNLVKSLKDYKYTTFEKFVKLGLYEEGWCNFEDKCILTLGLRRKNSEFDKFSSIGNHKLPIYKRNSYITSKTTLIFNIRNRAFS